MTRVSLALLSAAALAATALAQVPTTSSPDVLQAWQRFRQQHGSDWLADWSPATGTPRAIYGPGLRLHAGPIRDLDSARRQAAILLDRQADLLGRGASTFVESIAAKMGRTWVLVYDQHFRGLRVVDGRADVRLHEIGVLSMFGSRALPIPRDFDVTPRVAPEAALLTALRRMQLDAPGTAPAPELVVWGDPYGDRPSPVRLAWEVAVRRADAGVVGRVWVDARTGNVLRWRDELYHGAGGRAAAAPPATAKRPLEATATSIGPPDPRRTNVTGNVMAWTNTDLLPTAALVDVPVQNVLVQIVDGSSAYTDANGDFDIPFAGTGPVTLRVELRGRHVGNTTPRTGTKVVDTMTVTPGVPASVQLLTSNAGEFDRAQTTAYWAADDVNQWVRTLLVPAPSQLSRIDAVGVFTSLPMTCNAHYQSNTINFYQAGGGCVNTAYSTVIYHEWGHGLDDVFGGISQRQGLSEGWGDIVATYRTRQPIVGAGFKTNGSYVRTALNTRQYPPGFFADVHQQGEIWMGFAWDARRELINLLGEPAGVARAEQIVIGSIVANAGNQPDAVMEVFIADDDDGNLLNGTPHYSALELAAQKRNLPYPVRQSEIPGSYAAYGQGCAGTGMGVGENCAGANQSNTTNAGLVGGAALLAVEVTAPVDMDVAGFELLNSSGGGTVSIPSSIYTLGAGGNPGQQVRSTTMSVGAATAWHRATFSQPYSVLAGDKFFIVIDNPNGAVLPILFTGQQSRVLKQGLFGAWGNALFNTWAYRIKCVASTNVSPSLAASGVPEIGTTFSLRLSQAAASTSAVLLLGASKTQWLGFGLPLSLAPFGAPGCSVLASGDIQLPVQVDANGNATVPIAVPNDANLVRASLFNQFIVSDPGANSFGFAVSNGGEGSIGKP